MSHSTIVQFGGAYGGDRSGRAAGAWPVQIGRRALAWLVEAGRRYRSRRELARLDDIALKDIGLNTAEADYEANKPFWRA